MGKSTISMVIFSSYVKLPEGTHEKRDDRHMTDISPIKLDGTGAFDAWVAREHGGLSQCVQ